LSFRNYLVGLIVPTVPDWETRRKSDCAGLVMSSSTIVPEYGFRNSPGRPVDSKILENKK
jgi:hypothetical protein